MVGYLLAQLFMREFPGKGFFRTIHTLPLIVAPIVVGSVWRLMTDAQPRHRSPTIWRTGSAIDLNIGRDRRPRPSR